MKINKEHPEYVKFIKNEFKTLAFIKDQPYLVDSFPDLIYEAYNTYNINEKRINNHRTVVNSILNFEAKITLPIDGIKRQIFIGANVNCNFSHVSYMLAFCESDEDNSKLIRKFHFDYEINTSKSPKPVYHLQYGGELTPLMIDLQVKEENLITWLSIPRINHTPINLALLLDFIFVEFESPITSDIIGRSEWRDLIKDNEEFILKDYYKTIYNFFNSREYSSKNLFRDFSYGK
jgi:hypothetical protein